MPKTSDAAGRESRGKMLLSVKTYPRIKMVPKQSIGL